MTDQHARLADTQGTPNGPERDFWAFMSLAATILVAGIVSAPFWAHG